MVGEGGEVGLFTQGHAVVDIPGCLVLSPALAKVAAALRRTSLAPASPQRGGLVAIDLREVRPPGSSGNQGAGVLVTLVVVRGPAVRLEAYRDAARALMAGVPEVRGVAMNFHDGESPQVLGKETMVLAGAAQAEDVVGQTVQRATYGSFVQAHRGQAARIHERVVALVVALGTPEPRVLDLYSGSGALALPLARAGARVTMVESFAPAVAEAKASAALGGLRLGAEVADVADALARLARKGERLDLVVVNPPRRGLDPKVRARLGALAPKLLVYVSCQPETLARDLDHLARLGLRGEELLPFDMIPLTEEVETLAVLRLGPPLPPVVLYEDSELLVLDKPPHEPVTPQGEHEGSLLARAQKLPGCERAVPVHRLDVGTSGVVLLAKDPKKVAGWADALHQADGGKLYVAAVRGVLPEARTIERAIPVDGKEKPAQTTVTPTRVLAPLEHTLVRAAPREGRTHQIRRHLAGIGHAVLGDERYGHAGANRFFWERYGLDRTFLHLERVEVKHPRTGKRLVLEAALPGDLAAVLARGEGNR